jgi:hypothetical protein
LGKYIFPLWACGHGKVGALGLSRVTPPRSEAWVMGFMEFNVNNLIYIYSFNDIEDLLI